MKAFINNHPKKGGLKLEEVKTPIPKANDVLIKVIAVALNYRDLRMVEGNYSFKFKHGTIPGSDICGEVVAVGNEISKDWLGKLIIVNPNINWGNNFDIPSSEYSILGTPINGGLSEYFCCDANRIELKPEHLDIFQAASLPLTGTTAYRALFTKGELKEKENVLVTGISGGVAQIALQFAVAINARVVVTSSQDDYIAKAIKLGAGEGINYTTKTLQDESYQYESNFDIAVDSSGGEQLNSIMRMMKQNGKIILFGAMNGNTPNFDLATLYYKQIQLKGTLLGNDIEFKKMVNLTNDKRIVPVVDSVFHYTELNFAFDKLRNRDHFGKIVIKF